MAALSEGGIGIASCVPDLDGSAKLFARDPQADAVSPRIYAPLEVGHLVDDGLHYRQRQIGRRKDSLATTAPT